MEKIGAAVIGVGKVATTHANALQKLPEARLVAVCGRHPGRTQAFAGRYGVKGYVDYDELLRDPEVQVVVLCTPHPGHGAQAVAAARAGRHVLVEKPLAVTLRECDAAIAAADEAGVKLGVISQRRFYEPVLRVKQAIDQGKIGAPILGSVVVHSWRDEAYYHLDPWRGKWDAEGGGVLVNQSPHQLDLFQWFMGPIDELFGYWDNLNHPYIEVEDTAVAVLRFKNGALGTILVSNSQNPALWGRLHVHGANGGTVGVQVDGGAAFVSGVTARVEPPINDEWTVPGEAQLLPLWQAEDRARGDTIDFMSHYHELQIRDFLRAIIEGRAPAVDGREGRKAVEMFTAIYRSQRDRQPVKFPVVAEEGSQEFDGRLSPRQKR